MYYIELYNTLYNICTYINIYVNMSLCCIFMSRSVHRFRQLIGQGLCDTMYYEYICIFFINNSKPYFDRFKAREREREKEIERDLIALLLALFAYHLEYPYL